MWLISSVLNVIINNDNNINHDTLRKKIMILVVVRFQPDQRRLWFPCRKTMFSGIIPAVD